MAISIKEIKIKSEEKEYKEKGILSALHYIAREHPDGFTAVVKFESKGKISFTLLDSQNFKQYGRYVVAFTHLTDDYWRYWISYADFMQAYVTAYQFVPFCGSFTVGGWTDKDSNTVFIDIGVITNDLEKAKEIAKVFGQKAIWDFEAMNEIKVNDTEIVTEQVKAVERYLVSKYLFHKLGIEK
jgi:hypothetical protein